MGYPLLKEDGYELLKEDSYELLLELGTWVFTDWQPATATLKTNDTYSKELTGLTEGTEYEFQVQARNSAGEGDWSASAYFTTLLPHIYIMDEAMSIYDIIGRRGALTKIASGLGISKRTGT